MQHILSTFLTWETMSHKNSLTPSTYKDLISRGGGDQNNMRHYLISGKCRQFWMQTDVINATFMSSATMCTDESDLGTSHKAYSGCTQ